MMLESPVSQMKLAMFRSWALLINVFCRFPNEFVGSF